ncbi:MAG: zinc metallopeptidase [Deltaproteobacteria bacterium]|nr:zinc metallopeptidase [Deltaproteobacteria bacterium]
MFYFDLNYLLFISPAIALSLVATVWVKSAFSKWQRRALSSQMSGAQAARLLLDASGLRDVRIERVSGFMSDHYDPRAKVLRLSPAVHDGRSVSAVGVAAHEAGHALQDKERYTPLVWRTALVPIASIGSNLTWILLMVGVFFQISQLYTAAVVLFGGVVLFQLVTLPVEFNASSRAKAALASHGIVSQVELGGVSSVLTAAAMTYVAAALTAILQFVYFFLRARD